MTFLDRILASRRADVAKATDAAEVRLAAENRARPAHLLRHALAQNRIHIIAEFKRASPSLGPIRLDADLAQIVRAYDAAGVSAISVLTEPAFFRGSLDDLREARATTARPILRKDFTVSEYQIDEAAAAGADVVLLIVAALSDQELLRFRIRAEDELGLDALVEVHTAEEMKRAADAGATIVGVNNRDLRTFQTSLETSEKLAALAPGGATLISESGIATAADIVRLRRCGYRGFLIGESLMRASDPAALIRQLRGEVQIKVCGVTTAEDAERCAAEGVDMIGLNFAPESRRCLSVEAARAIVDAVRLRFPAVRFVGVFVNQDPNFINETARELGLAAVQLHGDETPDDVREINAPSVIKALRVGPDFALETAAAYECDAILLDAHSPHARGGTGERFDWKIAFAVKARVKRLILAGGLSPENVHEAIQTVGPDAVDVCSGIEESAGRKDTEKLRRFVAAARGTNS